MYEISWLNHDKYGMLSRKTNTTGFQMQIFHLHSEYDIQKFTSVKGKPIPPLQTRPRVQLASIDICQTIPQVT